MGLNVLVIPEDFRKDQFVLGPIIRRILQEAGRPQARVQVCKDPLLGGVSQALKWERIAEVIEMYPMVQVFLLIVDRDGDSNRRQVLNSIETLAKAKLGESRALFGEHAWQEIEVWALAGQDLPSEWRWTSIRAEMHPKERYFEPFADSRGLSHEPGEGRTTLGREAASNYLRLRSRCDEDVRHLEDRIRTWLER